MCATRVTVDADHDFPEAPTPRYPHRRKLPVSKNAPPIYRAKTPAGRRFYRVEGQSGYDKVIIRDSGPLRAAWAVQTGDRHPAEVLTLPGNAAPCVHANFPAP